MAETAKEIEQGLAFLRACNPRGPVYAALRPVLDDLQRAHASSSSTSSSAPAVTTALSAVEGIVVALHKAMVEEGFVCIVEKPSSVPGFAGTIRELLPHQLPDGWNSAQAAYALTYKHRLKAGKHFLLSGTVLADGALLATSVTEKGGHTAGTEFNVAEFAGVVAAAELKARLNALTRQLIPQLDPAAAVSSSSSSSSAAGMQQQQQPPPATPIFGGGSAGGSGGFPRIPVIPSVGSGDLHPALPGPGFGPGAPVTPLPSSSRRSLLTPSSLWPPRHGRWQPGRPWPPALWRRPIRHRRRRWRGAGAHATGLGAGPAPAAI